VIGLDGGRSVPIQWTGYESSVGKYQGEIMRKAEIHARFESKLRSCKEHPHRVAEMDWSGIREVLRVLFTAFQSTDAELIRRLALELE
jgi:hypothetical protein